MVTRISQRLDEHKVVLDSVTAGLGTVSTNLASVQAQVTAKFTEIEAKAKEEKRDFDTRLADLQKALAASTLAPPATTAAQSAAIAAASGSPASSSAHRRTQPRSTSQPPPRSTPPSASTGKKVLAFGFPRELPRKALLDHWNTILAKVPSSVNTGGSKFEGSGGKGYSIFFPSVSDALAFNRWARDNNTEWTGPRDSDTPVTIKYRILSSPEDSARGRLLSPVWEWLSKNLATSPAHKTDMYIMTNTRKGFIAVATDCDQWTVATISCEDNGNDTLKLDDSTIQHFAFDRKALARAAGQ
jgi:hypothetical protein